MSALPRALPPPTPAHVADLVQRIERCEARLERLEQRRAPSDPARDARLLSAIAACCGGGVFTAADLCRSSEAELRAAVGGARARTVGVWLRRLRGRRVEAYTLHRVKRGQAGQLWCVSIDDQHTHDFLSRASGGH